MSRKKKKQAPRATQRPAAPVAPAGRQRRHLVGVLIATGIALGVAGLWYATRRKPPPPRPVSETATTIRLMRPDAVGFAAKTRVVRDPNETRALVRALGIDDHPKVECPAEHVGFDMSITIGGPDRYASRTAYVHTMDGGETFVMTTSTSGCWRGPIHDRAAFERAVSSM